VRTTEILIVIAAGLLFISPIQSPLGHIDSQITDFVWPSDEWSISTAVEQNMSASHLKDMIQYFEDHLISINSIVIVRNGHIVLEEYFDFFDENTTVSIFSCTKTITSTLVGIAIDMGYIANTSIPILDYFPDRMIEDRNEWKESITIQDLLTMRAGFQWNDNSAAGMSEYNQMLRTDDWVQYVLDRPMAVQPGIVFNYNSGASLLLSAIVQNATGMTSEEFAEEYLFGPIGIPSVSWRESPQGITIGGNTLTLRAKDMARIGYLFLRNGSWNGNQVVSSDWISDATRTHSTIPGVLGYGYQIWIRDDLGSYSARGYAGQFIFVIPRYDLVVVFQATSGWTNTALEDWIIPSIEEFGDVEHVSWDSILFVAIIGAMVAVPALTLAILYRRRIGSSK